MTDDRVELQLRIAELAESKLGDWPRAAQAYEVALERAPGLYPALAGLARVMTKMMNPGRARQALEQIAERAKDPATQLDAYLRRGAWPKRCRTSTARPPTSARCWRRSRSTPRPAPAWRTCSPRAAAPPTSPRCTSAAERRSWR